MSLLSREACIAAAGTVAAVLIPAAIFMYARFPLKLSRDEQTLLTFSPSPVSLQPRRWTATNPVCPVTAAIQQQSVTEKNSAQTGSALSTEPDPLLTFILYSGSKQDIAILNGHLLRQGQRSRGVRLVKIEQKRVLIEDRKGTRWLTMD